MYFQASVYVFFFHFEFKYQMLKIVIMLKVYIDKAHLALDKFCVTMFLI